MSTGGRLSSLARARIIYTGESYQVAREFLKNSDNLRPIPSPSTSQALFESDVFSRLSDGGSWSAHPVGINGVRLGSHHDVIIYLDSHVELSSGDEYPMTAHALDRLLPYSEPGIQVNGVTGLRVAHVHGVDLHLRRVGTDSRIIIRGIPGCNWTKYLNERWNLLAENGYPPLWKSSSWTDHERHHEESAPTVSRIERDIAWLGSGLLRRVALFHTASSAYSTRSWISDDEWIFELDAQYDVGIDHETLLSRLTDPIWGLPLRIAEHYCTCGNPRLPDDSRYMRQCIYYLEHPEGRPCGLQIRFRADPAGHEYDAREQLERLGADMAWLDRVLPASGRSSDKEGRR